MLRKILSKIAALESVLEARDPALYKAYRRYLESEGEQDNSETPFNQLEGSSKKDILGATEE
jgi:hypothetical protein